MCPTQVDCVLWGLGAAGLRAFHRPWDLSVFCLLRHFRLQKSGRNSTMYIFNSVHRLLIFCPICFISVTCVSLYTCTPLFLTVLWFILKFLIHPRNVFLNCLCFSFLIRDPFQEHTLCLAVGFLNSYVIFSYSPVAFFFFLIFMVLTFFEACGPVALQNVLHLGWSQDHTLHKRFGRRSFGAIGSHQEAPTHVGLSQCWW